MPVDLTRSILVVLIPGGVAVAPWLFWLMLETNGYEERYAPVAVGLGLAIAVIAGLVCETLGTWIEVALDKQREAALEIRQNWFDYLALSVDPEPVGIRYLSRLATMFYFELAMFIAVVPFAAGSLALLFIRFPTHREPLSWLIVLVTIILEIYFWINARKTHEVLCKTRAELNDRFSGKPKVAHPK